MPNEEEEEESQQLVLYRELPRFSGTEGRQSYMRYIHEENRNDFFARRMAPVRPAWSVLAQALNAWDALVEDVLAHAQATIRARTNALYAYKFVRARNREDAGLDAGNCAVCMCNIEHKEQITRLTKCTHFFHSTCVDPWLETHGTCPMCRSEEDEIIESRLTVRGYGTFRVGDHLPWIAAETTTHARVLRERDEAERRAYIDRAAREAEEEERLARIDRAAREEDSISCIASLFE